MKKNIPALFFLLLISVSMQAQSPANFSVGQILAAGSNGLLLPNGTTAYAESIELGTGVTRNTHGEYLTTEHGGTLNGINNINNNSGTINSNALTLGGYTGSAVVGDFTRFSGAPCTIDEGTTGSNRFKDAIGFRVWFTQPVLVKEFLVVDVDGHGNNSEWVASFAYNGTSMIAPAITAGNWLTNQSRNVNVNWAAMVNAKIPGAGAAFSNLAFPKETGNVNEEGDPDEIRGQVIFDYSSQLVDNIFFLFGVSGEAGICAGTQNVSVSPVTLFAPNIPLPVTLTSFTGKSSDCKSIELNWSVTDAVNFSTFEVERSVAGKPFEKIGMRVFNGAAANYTFNDQVTQNGIYQYRLRLLDADGRSRYSHSVLVKVNCGGSQVFIYPNPAYDRLNVGGLRGGETIRVYAANGKQIVTKKASSSTEKIELVNMPAGYYSIAVEKNGERVYVNKFIVSLK